MRVAPDRSVAVLGTGSYLPERVVTNEELRGLCTNYDEAISGDFCTWVERVTHIKERRYAAEGETSADMGTEAAKRALEAAGVKPEELDLIIHASFTPSTAVPGDHVLIAQRIGARHTPSFTIMGACAGSVQAMALAQGLLAGGGMRRILVTSAETITSTVDFSDPLTAILFGDGAGACVLGAVNGQARSGGVLPSYLGFDFNIENIWMGNANLPFSSKVVVPADNGTPPAVEKPYLRMIGGRSVLRNAVNAMAESVWRVLGFADGPPRDGEADELRARIRLIPHQANGRIVDGLARKLGVGLDRTIKTVYHYGNVSAASNLMALDFAMREGYLVADHDPETQAIRAVHIVRHPIQPGDVVVLPSIGAGYLYGAVGFIA